MDENFATWAILELMGHRRLAGYVTEVDRFGTKMAMIQIPASAEVGHPDWQAIQYYGGSAIYCVTPIAEEQARQKACPPPRLALPWHEDDREDRDDDEVPY